MPTNQAQNNFPFVAWLRDVAPYIHSFRGKTFVIGFAGELVQKGGLEALIQDVAMLHAMGMRIGGTKLAPGALRFSSTPRSACTR